MGRLCSRSLVLLSIILLFASSVFAHKPVDIKVDADFKLNQLHIKVRHPVRKKRSHYVKKIIIIVDDKEPFVYTFFFQKGPYRQVTVDIPGLSEVERITISFYSYSLNFR